MTIQIMPGIRQLKPSKNGAKSALEHGLFKRDDTITTTKTCDPKQGQINVLSEAEAGYQLALEFLTPMAEAFRIRDRHWRVGSRYCSTLEEVIRAITDGELLQPEEVAW